MLNLFFLDKIKFYYLLYFRQTGRKKTTTHAELHVRKREQVSE